MDLRDEIERMAAECGGAVAVAATHLPVERRLEREAQRSFPSASVIKVPILAALHAEAEAGRLSWEERMPLTEAAKVPGSGVLRELHPGIELTLDDLARLMIVVSDNTATNLLIDRIGTGVVNDLMAGLGYEQTRLGRRMYDFAARDRGFENRCAAGEISDAGDHEAAGLREQDPALAASGHACGEQDRGDHWHLSRRWPDLRAIRPDRHFRAHRGCPRPRRCRGRHRPHRPGDLRCVGRGGQQLMRTDPMVPYPWPHSPQ